MKRILQIDGGGIRGIIPASVVDEIANITGDDPHVTFDLMTGTSTGSIIAAMCAAGVPARTMYNLYVQEGASLFAKNSWWKRMTGGPRYKRENMQAVMRKMIDVYGLGHSMGNVRTRLMTTTFNGCTGRTHYQCSWKDYHGGLDIIDCVSWSALSAVIYFGPISVPNYKYKVWYQRRKPWVTHGAVFYDGGQGRNNCTLLESITTAGQLGWLDGDDEVHILSLGCGAPKLFVPYRDADGRGQVGRIVDYIGQSREEAVHDQLHKAMAISKHTPGLHIHRIDPIIKESENKLDALDYIDKFVEYGNSMRKQIPDIFKGKE